MYAAPTAMTCKVVYSVLAFSLYLSAPFNLKDMESVEVVSYLEIYDGRTLSLETTLLLTEGELIQFNTQLYFNPLTFVFHFFSNFGVILRAGIIFLVLLCFLPLYTPPFKHTVSLINA